MYIPNMKNSKFIIDKFAKLIEQGIVSSKDLSTEILNIFKSKRDVFLSCSLEGIIVPLSNIFSKPSIEEKYEKNQNKL